MPIRTPETVRNVSKSYTLEELGVAPRPNRAITGHEQDNTQLEQDRFQKWGLEVEAQIIQQLAAESIKSTFTWYYNNANNQVEVILT